MQFYPHRTVEEQANRLPLEYQDNYKKTQLDRIEIDGCEIHGYFEYSFMEEKSFMEQPVRSQDGTIADLDDYTTFLTPRLIIKYNMMGIDDYRNLMTFLKSKNAFKVTCYDIVADRRVTHEMYFAPPSMPIIYKRYLAALGIQEYSIELIGTNRIIADSFTFYIKSSNGEKEYEANEGETWLSFVSRTDTDYKIIYSKILKTFVVGESQSNTIHYNGDDVSPHDEIRAIKYSTHYYSAPVDG
jgi:hypothetical protein